MMLTHDYGSFKIESTRYWLKILIWKEKEKWKNGRENGGEEEEEDDMLSHY